MWHNLETSIISFFSLTTITTAKQCSENPWPFEFNMLRSGDASVQGKMMKTSRSSLAIADDGKLTLRQLLHGAKDLWTVGGSEAANGDRDAKLEFTSKGLFLKGSNGNILWSTPTLHSDS